LVDDEAAEEIMLPLVEVVEPEVPDELGRPVVLALALVIATVAAAGDPKLAWPATSVSATVNCLPAARLVTGTETFLTSVSPSFQLTVPLVAT
jgi:hypothetical protein